MEVGKEKDTLRIWGTTPLHEAAWANQCDVAILLLSLLIPLRGSRENVTGTQFPDRYC